MIKIITDKKMKKIIEEELIKNDEKRWVEQRIDRLESQIFELQIQVEKLKGNENYAEKVATPKVR